MKITDAIVLMCYRLMLDITNRHVSAYVEHNSGQTVVRASTKEFCISRFLYKTSDIAAARNVGCVLAERCKQMGLYRVMWEHQRIRRSKKVGERRGWREGE